MFISPETSTVGFIGLGVMGKSMAEHILQAGYRLHVYTRTQEKAHELLAKGAIWQPSPQQIAENCDVIITMVGYPHDVEQIYLSENGLVYHAKQGTYLIDMTTSSPQLASRINEESKKAKLHSLDAPVSGGDIGAKNASLSIMVGGEQAAYESILPLLQIVGKTIVYQGKSGAGQHTKVCNQIAIASTMIGVSEALAYAKAANLQPETVLQSIATGAAGSWSLSNLGSRMIQNDFEAGFYIKHFIKDMGIALQSANEMNLQTPGLALAEQIYKQLAELGYNEQGTQAIYLYYTEHQ
ncbi:NAD(P)-dependent oxidoreductase [Paenibacillus yanchengensis]|uniref:NAD(P)-dependent oxidoreductase n=1 Tax=Paenibacillus yanchengensis TaxID=2035833 RepID=A0ABW4YP52_9BACL